MFLTSRRLAYGYAGVTMLADRKSVAFYVYIRGEESKRRMPEAAKGYQGIVVPRGNPDGMATRCIRDAFETIGGARS